MSDQEENAGEAMPPSESSGNEAANTPSGATAPPPIPRGHSQAPLPDEEGKFNHYQQQDFPQQTAPPPYQQNPMYHQPQAAFNPYNQGPIPLPNAGGVLTCGIIAIPFSIGLIGIILAIVALSMASTAENLYKANPGRYTEGSYSNLKGGRICAIIALVLFPVWIMVFIGAGAF